MSAHRLVGHCRRVFSAAGGLTCDGLSVVTEASLSKDLSFPDLVLPLDVEESSEAGSV